jgi:pyruvate dehydrogenase E2 component (dihydrolipoamide acetyltransferase)
MATPVVIPKQGETVEACVIVQWLKDVGEPVAAGEPICEVETDKAVFDVVSPTAGTLLARYFAAGDEVAVHQAIAAVGHPSEPVPDPTPLAAEATSPTPAVATEPSAPAASPVAASASAGNTPGISPRAARLAAVSGLDVSTLAGGSGPGGRIIERDVREAVGPRPGGLTGVRRVIAARMSAAATTTAPVTIHGWASAAALIDLRRGFRSAAGRRPTITDLVMWVVSRTLPEHPDLNATFDGETHSRHDTIDLGVAVDTPRGLLVPVVRDTARHTLPGLAAESARLVEACRDGTILPDDLQGGTFTVTNLGGFGIEHFTPILNLPQVAILGVGSIQLRTVADEEGTPVAVPHLALSLTVDHRVVDGAPAARFLQAVATGLAGVDRLVAEPPASSPDQGAGAGGVFNEARG